ncbi:glycosyltransferase [Thauera sp.]|uniref:glycosyltransferase family protein n=1 Tax=Thauera sp. TaxID=1905334 RepID=UPI0026234D4D|nr:glycosyltransferase [Thauera sp.]
MTEHHMHTLALPKSLSVAFAVTEIGPTAAAGDLFTAQELGDALQARFGWSVSYRPRGPGWYALEGVDLLVAMREDYDPNQIRNAKPGLMTLGWARNCFEDWARHPWVADFDHVLASSKLAGRFLSARLGRLVPMLRIAANPARFNIEGRPLQPALDFVFTGSFWGRMRDIARVLPALPPDFNGAVYGRGWAECPGMARFDRGFLPYAELAAIYRQAAIVIDDANHVTKDWAAANSRVFDALAAGCLVISNSRTVSDELFDGALPVYEDAASLQALLARYLEDVPARESLQARLRAKVLGQHCYEHRAFELGLLMSRWVTGAGRS